MPFRPPDPTQLPTRMGRPTSLAHTIERVVNGERVTITIAEAIVADLSTGGPIKASVERYVTMRTYFNWMRDGEAAYNAPPDGPPLTDYQEAAANFFHSARRAEAEGQLRTFGVVANDALRPTTITRTRTKRDKDGHILEVVTEDEVRPPNATSAKWLLSARWPEVWGQKAQVEVSGPEGGPISVEVTAGQVLDKLYEWQSRRVIDTDATVIEDQEQEAGADA